jgi:hypothetical protein
MIKKINQKIPKMFGQKSDMCSERLLLLCDMIQKEQDEDAILRLWKAFLIHALTNIYKFNTRAAEEMFKWGAGGYNWKRLHNTEGINYTLSDFKNEVLYISDRIGLDRLFRAHWLINQIMIEQRLSELFS